MRRAALVLVCLTGVAHAEEVDSVDLQVTAARVRLGELGAARFEVTLAFDVPAFQFGSTDFALPNGGQIEGATVSVDGVQHSLALDDTDSARKTFDDLYAHPGEGTARTWAAGIEPDGGDGASFELLAPEAVRGTLQLSIDAATCWNAGTRAVLVPAAWAPLLAGAGAVTSDDEASRLSRECDQDGHGSRTWVRIGASIANPVEVTGAQLTAAGTTIGRFELALAAELGRVPRDLYTVLVVDESRSLDDAERDAQRAVVAAYLRAAPRGQVQVVGYARSAQRISRSWTAAATASASIDRELRRRPARNGSDIARGLAAASELLATVHGTRRIVLFSDERLTDATLDKLDTLAARVPAGTIVHVVRPTESGDGIERNDDLVLATIAVTTEGLAVTAGGTGDATMLVRPTSLDNLAISAPQWDPRYSHHACAGGDRLVEGTSCEWVGSGSGAISITAMLWNHPVKRIVDLDDTHPIALARILASTGYDAPERVLTEVERIARAVNSVWSLVATWGDAGGYADQIGRGGIGYGSMSTSAICGGSYSDTGYGASTVDLVPELTEQLGPAVRACKVSSPIAVTVELTRDEIAGVTVEPANACVTERVWATNVSFADPVDHTTLTLRL
jgi:Mg-chelatase subunit ChlD